MELYESIVAMMLNWLRKKLGILKLEQRLADVDREICRLEKQEHRTQAALKKTQKHIRTGRRPQRYDQIERGRSRRQKAP